MASTQPLSPPNLSLRLLPPPSLDLDVQNLTTGPVFDIQPTLAEVIPFAPTRDDDNVNELTPFSFDEYSHAEEPDELEPIADLLTELDTAPLELPEIKQSSPLPQTADLPPRQTGYLNGVSLSAVLQMLHLERKTCVVDVSAYGWLGTLTLVNGELVDARVGDVSGEDAAFAILNWVSPQTSILDGVDLFRHTVQRPITQLIMDAVRIGDETGLLNPNHLPEFDRETADTSQTDSDWQWLVDSMMLAGAVNVRIVGPDAQSGTDLRHTGMLGAAQTDLARAIRTWAALLGPDCTEIVATRSECIVILALLDPERSEYVYAEASGPETAEMIRRSLRSVQRAH